MHEECMEKDPAFRADFGVELMEHQFGFATKFQYIQCLKQSQQCRVFSVTIVH